MSVRYRKSGCTNCKKSHKKCDEVRPKCSNCRRRKLECEYGSLFVLFNSEAPNEKLSNSRKADANKGKMMKPMQMQMNVPAKQAQPLQAPSLTSSASSTTSPLERLGGKDEAVSPRQILHPIPTPPQQHSDIIGAPLMTDFSDFQDLDLDLKYLDSILASNSRNITPVIPTEKVDSDEFVFNWDSVSPEDLSKLIELNDPFAKDPDLPFDDPKADKFFRAYFRQSKCVGNYLFNPRTNENLLIDWMEALQGSYPILTDIVYVITTYGISVLRPQEDRWNQIKNVYLKKCINTLINDINTHHPFELVSLLTVLILFYSVDTSTTANTWRKHLTCAFALIQRFDLFFPSEEATATVYDKRLTSVAFNLFHFLKDNFVYAECLAWISAPGGGILKNLQEINYLFQKDSYCEPILVDHLVLVKGSSKYITTVFGKLIRIIIDLRDNYDINISGSNCVFVTVPHQKYYQAGLDLIDELTQIEYKDLNLDSIDDTHLRATLRYSNRAFVLGLKLYIMVTLLKEPVFSPRTQELSRMISDCLANMPYSASQSVGIHWPIFIAALCSLPGPLRQQFVTHLTVIVDRGLTVATYTLQRLDLLWDAMANGTFFDESMHDNIAY